MTVLGGGNRWRTQSRIKVSKCWTYHWSYTYPSSRNSTQYLYLSKCWTYHWKALGILHNIYIHFGSDTFVRRTRWPRPLGCLLGHTRWPRPIGCQFFVGYFFQTSPTNSGCFVERDVQLRASSASSPFGINSAENAELIVHFGGNAQGPIGLTHWWCLCV